MVAWSIYFFLLISVLSSGTAQAETAKLTNEFRCGPTKLTQWQVDSAKKKISQVRTADFNDRYCEPSEVLPGTANAKTFFLDVKGNTLWERAIMVPAAQAYDTIKNKKLTGGRIPTQVSTVQIKLPWNKFTTNTKAIKIQMNDGTIYGPIQL